MSYSWILGLASFFYIGKISPKSELRIKFEIEVDIFGVLVTKSEKKFSEKSLDFYIWFLVSS
jgi:hypothetical protein